MKLYYFILSQIRSISWAGLKGCGFPLFLFTFTFSIYSWVFFLDMPLSRDEANFILGGKMIYEGYDLYEDYKVIRSPLPYYFVAFFMSLSNNNLFFVRLLVPLFTSLTGIIIYCIGKENWNSNVGKIASVLYVIGILMPRFEEFYLMSEDFEFFFGTLSIYFYLKFNTLKKYKYLFVSGICIGLSFLSKQYGLLFFSTIIFYEALFLFQEDNRNLKFLLLWLRKTAIIFTGLLTPIAVLIMIYWINGTLDSFIEVFFGGTISAPSTTRFFQKPDIERLIINTLSFSIVYLFALLFTYGEIKYFFNKNKPNLNLFVVCWAFVFSLLLALATTPAYLMHTFQASVLMTGIFLDKKIDLNKLFSKESFSFTKNDTAFNYFVASIFVCSLVLSIWPLGIIQDGDERFTLSDQKEISRFIQESTEDNEKILAYHFAPEFYYLSDRQSPFEWCCGIGPRNAMTESILPEVMEGIKRHDVKYLVVYKGSLNETIDEDRFPESVKLVNFLRNNYTLINGDFKRFDIYYRDSNEEWV